MFSSRRLVVLLVLLLFITLGPRVQSLSAQASSAQSSSAQPTPAQSSTSPSDSSQAPAAAPPSNLSVQARIRARREQRRANAIHDVYSHLYEAYVGGGYLRFQPGKNLQRLNEYAWNVGVTRYYNQKFGVTIDGRGTYGTAFIGLNPISNGTDTNPSISEYAAMIGPTYRFVLHPKYSISGRVMGGGAYGNFSSDIGSFTPAQLGLYSNGSSVAVSASIPLEYNFSPAIGLRIAPEYMLTSFGSTIQHNPGFTGGVVVRWGKQ